MLSDLSALPRLGGDIESASDLIRTATDGLNATLDARAGLQTMHTGAVSLYRAEEILSLLLAA